MASRAGPTPVVIVPPHAPESRNRRSHLLRRALLTLLLLAVWLAVWIPIGTSAQDPNVATSIGVIALLGGLGLVVTFGVLFVSLLFAWLGRKAWFVLVPLAVVLVVSLIVWEY